MTKLSDLKVGDKFRFADDRESTEEVLIDGPRKRGFDGQDEWSYWNANQGYRCSAHDSEVVPIREPEYRPYSDQRAFEPHRDRWLREVAIKRRIRVSMYDNYGFWHDGTQTRINWQQAYEDFVYDDDGTPCGELVE